MKNNRGFTLLEVLVYIALASVLIPLMFDSFFRVFGSIAMVEEVVEALYEQLFISYE